MWTIWATLTGTLAKCNE